MQELLPKIAAGIAVGVYDVRTDARWNELKNDGASSVDRGLNIFGQFSANGGGRFSGTSGGNLLRSTTGFGYVAEGVGARQGELLIATRGTELFSAFDWVTDASQALRRSSSGYAVHAGFQKTFESFLPDLEKVLGNGTKRPTVVHAVGHSLGGALATLVADYASSRGIATRLYTFGCPRVGFEEFNTQLTRKIGAENIFRVYSSGDPVAMVPIFPFCHAPIADEGYPLECKLPVSFLAHLMGNYIGGVGEAGWRGLKRSRRNLWMQAEVWLEEASAGGGGGAMHSAATLGMIMKCLRWILTEVGGSLAGLALLGAATVIDLMSQLLYRGVLQSVKLGKKVTALMNVILRFLGRTAMEGVSITVHFISWVLSMLFRFVSTAALHALYALQRI